MIQVHVYMHVYVFMYINTFKSYTIYFLFSKHNLCMYPNYKITHNIQSFKPYIYNYFLFSKQKQQPQVWWKLPPLELQPPASSLQPPAQQGRQTW